MCFKKVLKNKILVDISIDEDNEEMVFTLKNGDKYRLYHEPDCCEVVTIAEVIGDLKDLIGEPLLQVEEVIYEPDTLPPGIENKGGDDSFSWTFYKLGTIKGNVTIRWLGESNGYYSESVDFEKVEIKN